MSIVTTVSFASDIGKNDLFMTIVATHFRQELISKMICKYRLLTIIWKMGLQKSY